MAHPILNERPIVVAPKGLRLCRRFDQVLEVLDDPDVGPSTKEEGEVVRA